MKKHIIFWVALVLLVTMVGCTKDDTKADSNSNAEVQEEIDENET